MNEGQHRKLKGCEQDLCRERCARWLGSTHGHDCGQTGLKLCRAFEWELLDALVRTDGPQTLEGLQSFAAQLQGRHIRAQVLVQRAASSDEQRTSMLDSWQDFWRFARHLHQQVFGRLDFAGRCREETVWFDRHRHEREGSPVDEILTELERLHQDVIAPFEWTSADADALARQSARFLVRFFRVHPFADGNGRTGRLLTRFLVEATGNFRLTPWPEGRRARQGYLKALRYAHRRLDPEFDGRLGDPYWTVQRYIRKLIAPAPAAQPLAPPTWLK